MYIFSSRIFRLLPYLCANAAGIQIWRENRSKPEMAPAWCIFEKTVTPEFHEAVGLLLLLYINSVNKEFLQSISFPQYLYWTSLSAKKWVSKKLQNSINANFTQISREKKWRKPEKWRNSQITRRSVSGARISINLHWVSRFRSHARILWKFADIKMPNDELKEYRFGPNVVVHDVVKVWAQQPVYRNQTGFAEKDRITSKIKTG